ncbi:cytochrome P450 [Streptomyces sp. NPDC088270]|uniref:cytochrome P450 n=1 Tax=Streptomyces sp. NPDC088270 TaxID=3160990 RepID=UPI003443F3FF
MNPRIPLAPGAWPVLGHAPALVRNPANWLSACRRAGDVVQVNLGTRRVHLLCAPRLANDVLVVHDDRYDKGGPLYERAAEVLGEGLFTATGHEHRRRRRLLQPAFSPANIDTYTGAIHDEATALADSWHPHQEVDVLDAMHAFTTGVLRRVLIPTAPLPSGTWLATRIKTVSDTVALNTLAPFTRHLPTPGRRRSREALRDIRAAADHTGRTSPDSSRLIAALTKPDPDGDLLSDENLSDQIITMFGAGTETTAAILAWILHLLADHPGIEHRLHEELHTVLHDRLATPADFRDLPHTRNVITETLRLYPTLWLTTRVSTADVTLAGHRFTAGTDFVLSPYQLQRDPAVFPHPDTFDPDRWNTRTTGPARQAFTAFSAGRRKCIGDAFALAEATIVLSALIPRWQLRPVNPAHPARPRFRTLLTPHRRRMTAVPRHPTPQIPR